MEQKGVICMRKKKKMGLDRGRIVGAMGTVQVLCNAKAWAKAGGVVRL